MIIRFKDNYIKQICNDLNFAKQNYPQKVVSALQTLLERLDLYDTFDRMYMEPLKKKYRTHPLKGNKKGIISLSLDYHYRMTLTVAVERDISGKDIVTILEVTNHYGD